MNTERSKEMYFRQSIEVYIAEFIRTFSRDHALQTAFGAPLVGFADADSDDFRLIRSVTNPNHAMPRDILPNASLVIAYYIPFTRALAAQNNADTCPDSGNGYRLSAETWAQAYLELNTLIGALNTALVDFVRDGGFDAAIPAQASQFNPETLRSDWSQRHVAYAAGLGTFGMNNMLLTPKGCCGRYSSIVTAIPHTQIRPDTPRTEELCRYKRDGSCGVCMQHCPVGALQPDPNRNKAPVFHRRKCYAVCLRNDARYPGAEVCGKCVTSAACAFGNPD